MITQELYDFFVSWINWVDRGAPERHRSAFQPVPADYYRSEGLCLAIQDYPGYNSVLEGELTEVLAESFDETDDPFGTYHARAVNRTQHENPRRLRWVRARIEEYEDAL